MTNCKCIYRKTVDYKSRMAFEKDDLRWFSVIWEFRVTGNWVAARVASRVNWAFKKLTSLSRLSEYKAHLYLYLYTSTDRNYHT